MKQFMRRGVTFDFCCPRCGCSRFGSVLLNKPVEGQTEPSYPKTPEEYEQCIMVRHCSGCPMHGERLTFPSEDDYKYFTIEGVKYDSQEAFERELYTTDPSEAAIGVGQMIRPRGGSDV